jgi:predicted CoA-binding protein
MRGRELVGDSEILLLLASVKRVCVLGIRPESYADRPAFYVPKYLADAGLDLFPVPTDGKAHGPILGRPVFARVENVPPRIDLVDVFRKAEDIPAHLPDLLAAKPRAVWFQLGIRNDAVAAELVANGIDVVQDRCLMVEHRKLFR